MTALADHRTFVAPAWGTRRRPERPNDLAALMAISEALGAPLLPWQQEVGAVLTERLPDGRLAYGTAVLSVPRRAGKTQLLVAMMLLRMLRGRRSISAYVAQQGRDAIELFRELADAIEDSPVLRGKFTVYRGTGSETITNLDTRGKARFLPPMRKTGHGRSTDFLVWDEAWGIDQETGRMIEVGLLPTLATRQDAMLVVSSAAGDLRSTWWAEWVTKGERAAELDTGTGMAAWHWGADGPADDPATWRAAHPALDVLVPESFLRDQLNIMSPEDFARAFCNQRVTSVTRAIPAVVWEAAREPEGIPRQSKVAFGLDVAADRSTSAIVAAALVDGVVRLEVVEQAAGVGWVAGRMKEIASRNPHLGICIDPIGPAAMIADALGATATTMNTASMITACDAFMVGLTEGTIQHRGDPALDIAVESAVKRMIGDAGWAWGRTKSAGSIAPLVAATLAAWQVTHTPPPRARAKVW